jgi:hypothetical protein
MANQQFVVAELGIPISYDIRDFTGRPLDELKFVVHANLTRRHLDQFQKAEVAIKFGKLFRKIARERWTETKFTSETAREAGVKSGISRQPQVLDEANERLPPGDWPVLIMMKVMLSRPSQKGPPMT